MQAAFREDKILYTGQAIEKKQRTKKGRERERKNTENMSERRGMYREKKM